MPEWILHLLKDQKGGLTHTDTNGNLPNRKIPKGQGNDHLTSLAGTMRRRGMEQASIEAALFAENQAKCEPPLEDEEIHRIATSVSR